MKKPMSKSTEKKLMKAIFSYTMKNLDKLCLTKQIKSGPDSIIKISKEASQT